MPTKILLADDHTIIRDGLRSLLTAEPDMEVVGEASDGREAVRLAREVSPDVAIMDVSMPELNGVEAARQLLAEHPETKVIALSMHSDKRYVARMLQAGAVGYLLKDCAFDELVAAVRSVLTRGSYLSPGVAGAVIGDYVERLRADDTERPSTLSPREREVLQLVAEGKSTRDIAAALFVSVKTIESHRRQIMQKLGLKSVAQLTKYAIREGLTTLEA